MNIHKQLIVISILLSSIGIAVAAPLGVSWFQQQNVLATAVTEDIELSEYTLREEPTHPEGLPRHISVPSLGIETDVADGEYDFKTGQWSVGENSAFHASVTSPINADGGNTLIYGLNDPQIFGNLSGIQPGSEIVVSTDTGYTFTYTSVARQAMQSISKSRLMLQVCSGKHNQTNQMFYSELKKYEKPLSSEIYTRSLR